MPTRFCAQCGAKAGAGAKFCTDCGARIGIAGAAAEAPRWQPTIAGAAVLATFLAAGLTVWTFILTPDAPRPLAPPPAASAAPAAAPGQRQGKVELPAEVKSFIAELSGKAKEKPDDTDTWLKLGQVNARASQLDPAFQGDAIAAFEHVLERDPKNADALRGLANVHYDRDDHRKAIPAYEKYLAIRPEDPSARTDLATMYLYGGDPDRAIATYQAVIRDNPSFLQAHYNLAVTYHGQGNDTEALKELQIARGLATEDAARKQIDDMIASLGGTRPAPADGAPTASVAAQPAPRAPFQTAVEAAFRASPIMGSRIVRFDWSGPASGTVVVQNFPMEGMPAEVRDKFTARLTQEVRSARESHPTDGPVRLDISDAGSGKVMASITL